MAYTTPQLLSTTSHHSPLPMFINKSPFTIHHSCPSNKRQIFTRSSSKVPRFGIANAMASKEIMLLSTAQQPYKMSTPFRSTTAHHQSFAPSCDHQLLVVLENSIEHAAHMFETALLEYLENLEEKLSKVNIEDPNALTMIQLWIRILINGLFHPGDKKPQKPKSSSPDFRKDPHAKFVYTFYYGSKNKEWIKEFKDKAEKVIEDPCIKDMINVRIELCSIREFGPEDVRVLSELINIGSGANQGPFSKPLKSWFKSRHACLRDYFKSSSDGRFVFTENQKKVLLNEEGGEVLQVLKDFPHWKNDVGTKGFELSFIDYYKGKKFPR